MNSQPGTFLSGLVLGLGVGLFAGHLTIWNRPQPLEFELAPLSGQMLEFDPTVAFSEQSGSPDNLFDAGELGGGQEETSASMNGIGSELDHAIAMEAASPLDEATSLTTPAARTTRMPRMLRVADATPLAEMDGESPANKAIRAIIDRELSSMPQPQREIWYESLKGMNREDVSGILRMWQLFGGQPPSPALLPLHPGETGETGVPQQPAPAAAEHPANSWQEQVAAIHRTNLYMAGSPGYLRQIPFLFELADADAANPGALNFRVGTRPDFDAVEVRMTGIPLDLAIKGVGFFAVDDANGQRFYTRNGRFAFDTQRRMMLQVNGENFLLQPEVRVPEQFERVLINEEGGVTFSDADNAPPANIQIAFPLSLALLRHHANGMYTLAPEHSANMVLATPGKDGAGRLLQHCLEFPVIHAADEARGIEMLQSSWQHDLRASPLR